MAQGQFHSSVAERALIELVNCGTALLIDVSIGGVGANEIESGKASLPLEGDGPLPVIAEGAVVRLSLTDETYRAA